MMVVESGVNARVFHFGHQVHGAGEIVRRVSDKAIDGELQIRSSEITLQNRRDRAGDAAVRSGIFRMSWCARQREPIGICDESSIAAASADGGYRPPETEGKFSVPAPDGRVRESGPQHGHQSRAIGSVEAPLCCQSPESAAVLLAGVLGPEKTNLCLLRGANRAVQGAERFHLVVVVDPLLAVECIGTFVGEELCRSGHGERLHLTEPRRYRRREDSMGSLVKTLPGGRSVRKINE